MADSILSRDLKRVSAVSCAAGALLMAALPAWGQSAAQQTEPPRDKDVNLAQAAGPAKTTFGGDFWTRPKLTGDWGGARDRWAASGVTIDFDAYYTLQGLADGGVTGPAARFSSEDDVGNTLSGDLVLQLDTGKAGLWPGAFFKARLEGRTGASVVSKAGTISPVNIDAMFPNSNLDDETWGLTELTAAQFLSPKFGVVGGLLNTADGDFNAIAGNSRNNDTFMNMAFLLSPVEITTVPNVTLGGGVIFLPTPQIKGSLMAFNSEESATENPFEHTDGTTFATEWTFGHTLDNKPGAQVVGALYGINKNRADIAQDPRVFIRDLLVNQSIPETDKDSWALYYNAHQYIQGDSKRGWGPFIRLGLSDGDPNPVKWNIAGGLGGKGPFASRPFDGWGAGVYYLEMSDAGLLDRLDVGNEVGGEVYYNFAITPALKLTFDAQVVDSARPNQDTAWLLGMRLGMNF